MLITFSGLDGSGKSTLIGSLKTALEAKHTAVVVCHMNHDIGIFAAVRAVRDRLLVGRRGRAAPGTQASQPGEAPADYVAARRRGSRWRDLRYAIVWNRPSRRLIYLGDLVIFGIFRFYVERMRRKVLIMDRYFYDTLVDVAGPHSWAWARVLAWLTPTPEVAVLLNTSPAEAFARKREYSIDYLAQRSSAYRRVFSWVPSAIILDHADLAPTTRDLERLVEAHPR